MYHNRIARSFRRISALPFVMEHVPRPSALPTPTRSTAMVIVPLMVRQGTWQAELYRLAYERALADLTPPWHHRRFFSVWN